VSQGAAPAAPAIAWRGEGVAGLARQHHRRKGAAVERPVVPLAAVALLIKVAIGSCLRDARL